MSFSRLSNATKRQNHPGSVEGKAALRRWALEQVPSGLVLDAFAGEGQMWKAVWHDAKQYAGCDVTYRRNDKRRLYVANNLRLLRNLDLSMFSIFDFDAFGNPWPQVYITAHRRPLKSGERVAFILTDGTLNALKTLSVPTAFKLLTGLTKGIGAHRQHEQLHRLAVKRAAEIMGGRIEAGKLVAGKSEAKVLYSALRHFELRGLYGPRFLGASSFTSPAISSIVQT